MNAALTPQQRDAAYAMGADLCVDAGAGSGKTTVLVERIMHLLDRGIALRRIVAITFTRKASGEMKERLREAIHKRPENNPGSMDKWRALELDVESARITTIDGFCAALLHENALHLGLDPDFDTLGEDEASLLQNEVIEATLAELLDRDDGPAHRLVVEHGLERLTIFLYEALNRETRFKDSARRYAGLNADDLAARWRNEADQIQRERYEALTHSPEIARVCTDLRNLAHQCSDTADKRESVRQDAIRFLTLICESRNAEAVREGIAGINSLNLRGGKPTAWLSKESMEAVSDAVKRARKLAEEYEEPPYDPTIERAAAQLTLDLIAVVAEIAEAYRAAKHARTALDFQDLLALTVQMLGNRPEFRERIAAGIDHLLIDEFQDTNHEQLALATSLTGKGGAELFVVGDAKQSVYRFRGAEVEVFAGVKEYTRKTLRLDENFRSVRPLIGFINRFFDTSGLLTRVEPTFHYLTAQRQDASESCIEFLIPEMDEETPTEDPDGDEPSESAHEAEANLIADRIAELCGPSGVDIYEKARKERRRARFGDIAILYHAATHSGTYEEALRRHGIPANVISGAGFYARQEILDLHNLFSVALDPWNEPALAAFLRSPLAGVSDDTLFQLTRTASLALAFWNGDRVSDPAEDAILDRARARIAFVQARRERPVPALLRDLLLETGYESVLLSLYRGIQKAGNIHKLIDLARGFGGAGRHGLSAFTQHLASLARNGQRSGDAEMLATKDGAVTLMTVHKAKGLEFPIVIVAETGRPPRNNNGGYLAGARGLVVSVHDDRGEPAWPVFGTHLHRFEKDDEAAEDARVLYVAMTRARDRLLISGPAKPKSKTWMAALNNAFNLTERKHGELIGGDGWNAGIVRRATGISPSTIEPVSRPSVNVDSLLHQATTLDPVMAPGRSISVGTLLDRMHPASAGRKRTVLPHIDLDRRLLGIAAHAMLERWNFAGPPPIAQAAHECFPAPNQNKVCTDELTSIATRVQNSALWRQLTGVASLRRELPFLFDIGGVLLSGVIDALLDGTTIIDYKLGAPTPERTARYQTQLRIYAAAIHAASGRAPSSAALYYFGSGDLVKIDVQPKLLEETLEQAAVALSTGFVPRAASGEAGTG